MKVPLRHRAAALVPSSLLLLAAASAFVGLGGCHDGPRHYATKVEVLQTQTFGRTDAGVPILTDVEVRFSECPGEATKVVRGDREFSACTKLRKGDKVEAELVHAYSLERDQYRSQLVRLGECETHADAKDEANYEVFENCEDLVMTGQAVGVRCDRNRSKGLLAKCPWMRRD
jgi:hypothetical protein